FLNERDERAFAAIICRHGPMVYDICRGVLANEADCEDAFQATFFVLARKAGAIRKKASLGSWLHGVAYRTAQRAKVDFARRRAHHACAAAPALATMDDAAQEELRAAVHEELERLGEYYRTPLILHYLQGKTLEEASELCGISKGKL